MAANCSFMLISIIGYESKQRGRPDAGISDSIGRDRSFPIDWTTIQRASVSPFRRTIARSTVLVRDCDGDGGPARNAGGHRHGRAFSLQVCRRQRLARDEVDESGAEGDA